jgi:hypothetical protein
MKPLTKEQYEGILRIACPFCQYGIPDVRVSDREEFVHRIAGTTLDAKCWANRIRGNLPVEAEPLRNKIELAYEQFESCSSALPPNEAGA